MINFLVKLANLLDEQGKFSLAREVDGLIEKLAQNMSSPDDNMSVAPQPEPLQSLPQDGMGAKTPAAKPKPQKPRKNPLIVGIESMLGLSGNNLDGIWSPGLNTLFVQYMGMHHPTLMNNGKFMSSLQEAYNVMKQDKETPPKTFTGLEAVDNAPAEIDDPKLSRQQIK